MPKNVYEVQMKDGRVHEVETPHSHEDHDKETFAKHLLDVLKGSAGNLISEVIVRVAYKGRRH